MDWIHGAKERWRRKEEERQKKRSWERGDGERRKCAHFYAQGNPICQLLRDGKLEWETIGEWFFGFFSKKKDEEEK